MNETPNVSSQASLKLDLLCNPEFAAYEVIAARLSGHWFPRGKGNKARWRVRAMCDDALRKHGSGYLPVRFIRASRYAKTGKHSPSGQFAYLNSAV